MAVLPILKGADNPMLRIKTEKVPKVTKKVIKLIKDMVETMIDANGVGLAAPQVGNKQRLCLVTIDGKLTALINPEITWKTEETYLDEEGCLSLPTVWMQVPRAKAITITFMNDHGKNQERKLEMFDARVVQHEVDHLNGKLIVDYMTDQKIKQPVMPKEKKKPALR